MYLDFFKLDEMPFSLTPNTAFYCALAPHNEALKVLLGALSMSEGFLKVTGEVGTGKTLICRKLINLLEDKYVIAYLPNPYLSPDELRWALASELGLTLAKENDQQRLSQAIEQRLLEIHQSGKKAVMIIDEAQCLSWDALEALRLFTNLETEQSKLLQVVMFGQPELDTHLANPRVRQLRQRISFSYQLRPMTDAEVMYYINHRLKLAGAQTALFSQRVAQQVAKASRGIPRLVNTLCHKALLQAYSQGRETVKSADVSAAVADTEDCTTVRSHSVSIATLFGILMLASIAGIWVWRQGL